MTLMESVRNFIKQCPHIDIFSSALGVDYLAKNNKSYSIEEVPCTPSIKKYIDGSGIYQYIFIFSSREAYGADVLTNIDNLGFYELFSTWLEEQSELKNLPKLENGDALKIEALTNGYALEIDIDNARYQIQCKLTYFKERG